MKTASVFNRQEHNAAGIRTRSFYLVPSKDGLVKANMEKLTFYALSAPEKLDRIGAYLSERLSRDVARHRYG